MFVLVMFLSFISICCTEADAAKRRILYVDSYNQGYMWSADITAGIKLVLSNRDDLELKIFRMDTKRNKTETFKKKAAIEAKRIIDTWHPDLVIASDDNAAKYLIVPYFLGSDLPFVFCGLNWDASVYGFPARNITGMIEVALYKTTIDAMGLFANGTRIGYLASDTESERKEMRHISKRYNAKFQVRFVKSFAELQKAFLELQEVSDMILLQECRSVTDFDHSAMIRFVNERTTIPTGALQKYLRQYTLLTFAKNGEEQGMYAAETALEILNGRSINEIPVVTNKRAVVYLNMRLAKKMGLKFPMELIENAHLISAAEEIVH